MTYCHPLCAMSIGPPILRYNSIKIWPWKSMVKVTCVVKGQSHVWPSNSRVKVMVKVKLIGHIWGLEFNRYVCFSFRGNRNTFGWDIGNSIFDLENSRSRLWLRSNLMVTFFGLVVQSIRLLFVSWQSDHFWLGYSKFYIWPWKILVKVMAKVKPDGHIWALGFHCYVCFPFHGNRTIFGWDIANFIFDLEKSKSRSWSRSNPMVTFEP